MHAFFPLKSHGAIIIGIEGVAIIQYHIFTRVSSFMQTFIILYTVSELTRQNLS